MKKKRLINSLAVVTLAVAAVVGGTSAYFSDTETSSGNVLAAGAIDLKIDNTSYYNYLQCAGGFWTNPGNRNFTDPYLNELSLGDTRCQTSWALDELEGKLFFDFNDLKPGDWGEDTISIHVVNNDAWVCMDINVTDTLENERTDPEKKAGDLTPGDNEGELQKFLRFVWWADDGDNVLEEGEEVFAENVTLDQLRDVALADSTRNIWLGSGPVRGGDDPEEFTYYVGKAWCFGDLTLSRLPQNDTNRPYIDPGIRCNGKVEGINIAQTDSVLADVTFTAVQSRHNGMFRCATCIEESEEYASTVYSYSQGNLKNGSPVTDPARTNPDAALVAGGNFFSLGFGGQIVVELAGPVTGSDVTTLEVTNGRSTYPEERADVYVAEYATGPWFKVGTASSKDNSTGVSVMDITGTGLPQIRFVRLVDVTVAAIHAADADGYDVDGVKAVVCLDNVVREER